MKKISTLLFALFAVFALNAQTVLHSWDFNDVDGTGGNDGGWSGSAAASALASYGSWTMTRSYKGLGCVKMGTGSAQGIAITPALTSLSGDAVLTFRAGAWNGTNEQTELLLEITGGGSLSESSVTLAKGAFTAYTVNITGGTAATKITFKGKQPSNSRFFLDDVVITSVSATAPLISVDHASLDFDINLGTPASENLVVTGKNLDANIALAISGADAAFFNVSPASIDKAGATVTVTYNPTEGGAHTALLTLTSGTATTTVDLAGTAFDASNPYNLDDSSPLTQLNEDFESTTGIAAPADWTLVSVTGDRVWESKTFNSNRYMQMSANSGTGAYDVLLISPAINLDKIVKSDVKFSWLAGYANGATLNVNVINKAGSVLGTVKSITATTPTGGYDTSFTTETVDLSAYSGVAFLAFQYIGDAAAPKTTTYQVDNVVVQFDPTGIAPEAQDAAFDVQSVNGTLVISTDANAVQVYNTLGQLIASKAVNGGSAEVAVQAGQIVIVKAGDQVKKVVTK